MIKVSVLYPKTAGSHFDIDYYCNKHMPMVKDKLGAACKGLGVDQGIGDDAPYAAVGHLFFDSAEAFQAAFGPHADVIMADIPNYTNVQPVVLMSAVLINATRSQAGELHLHRAG